ncbi:hypothetical protein NADFUDRAFT_45552 [Nadsonia fulvescens var. elongata DSM 6958]|uniref:GPN-loop GTPase n=1 Tax=Nadsonia fulvescens var. elongata DSM 6958 TaxID=857566 RepID=A0A1E3PQD7_9ASCO|nr:hypothetical protein NADFUDRAFT_45552 [Nadsonia fulvescens var. elongata DSM 6958]
MTAIFCIGMAGSGKTTFMQRLNSHLHAKDTPPYVINLDPAVLKVPFHTHIDIRDAINYKKVQKQYNLGPNGAIMTSLNLFSTKIDQVLGIVEKRVETDKIKHVLVDTPGQIECFIWSASGAIVTDALASSMPTVIAYIVDTPRTTSPATFMSNMLYACSILYKTKLPMIIVFNKCDAQDAEFAKEWMTDFEAFQETLRNSEDLNGEGENSSGYMGSLMNSLSLMLEEFYRHLDVVSVSAYTGAGFDEFLEAVDRKKEEYEVDYKAERERILKEREETKLRKKEKDLARLMKDMDINPSKADSDNSAPKAPIDSISDTEDISEDEDEDTVGLVERDEDEGINGGREYNFTDREGEVNDRSEESLQARYKNTVGSDSQIKTKSLEAMEKVLKNSYA